MKALAIIPARGGSKRIPRKNIRSFCGQPIISYSIKAAIDSGIFTEIMISTDDDDIAGVGKSLGASVPFLRSQKNSDDFATTSDVIREVLENYKSKGVEFDFVCCIYPTAPFVSSARLNEAFEILNSSDTVPSVVPIVKFGFPIQRALRNSPEGLSFREPEHRNTRSQDLEPMYHDSGQFYFLRVDAFLKTNTLFPPASKGLVLEEMEVQDIDNESDWILAEAKFTISNQLK